MTPTSSTGRSSSSAASRAKLQASSSTSTSRTLRTIQPALTRKSSTLSPALKPSTGRTSKASGPNTSLAAYPSTDPIGALSTLLKLLTALPSRIGGCQYKLTPAEHKLAIHLVGVVDPFVCHGVRAHTLSGPGSVNLSGSAAGLSIASLPTELIDLVLAHVDARKDLLNTGLVSKRLHDIVFPRHFDYRVIRCKGSSVKVWKHLITHGALARNVRKVEILDERERHGRVMVPRMLMAKPTSTSMSLVGGGVDTATSSTSSDEDNSKKLNIHMKHERLLSRALMHMVYLKEFRWSCNHSPITISTIWSSLMNGPGKGLKILDVADNMVFHPGLSWAVGSEAGSEESGSDSEEGCLMDTKGVPLLEMSSVVFRSTSHAYGAAKNPDLGRIGRMLHQCVNLKNLEISYIQPRVSNSSATPVAHANVASNPSRTRPLADQLLMYTKFGSPSSSSILQSTLISRPSLTSLTLNNLRLTSPLPLARFLSVHAALENLSLVDVYMGAMNQAHGWLQLPSGTLPNLKEIRATKEIINAILECPLGDGELTTLNGDEESQFEPEGHTKGESKSRPLEVVKGFKLSGHYTPNTANVSRSIPDAVFLANLRGSASRICQIELVSWHEMDDIRKLTVAVPGLEVLDVGKKVGMHTSIGAGAAVANITEWTELLSTMPELKELRGVKFFYEVSNPPTAVSNLNSYHTSSHTPTTYLAHGTSPSASTSNLDALSPHPHLPLPSHIKLSTTDRSRLRKNEEIAGLIAWKSKQLRKVDWWDDEKVVILVRGDNMKKARWEVHKA